MVCINTRAYPKLYGGLAYIGRTRIITSHICGIYICIYILIWLYIDLIHIALVRGPTVS